MNRAEHDQQYDAAHASNDLAMFAALLPLIPADDPRREEKLHCCAWNAFHAEPRTVSCTDIKTALFESRAGFAIYSVDWWRVSLDILVILNGCGDHVYARELAAELKAVENAIPNQVAKWRWYLYHQQGVAAVMLGHDGQAIEHFRESLQWADDSKRAQRTRLMIAAGLARMGDVQRGKSELSNLIVDSDQVGLRHWVDAVIDSAECNWISADHNAQQAIREMRQSTMHRALLFCMAEAALVRARAAVHLGQADEACLHALNARFLLGDAAGNRIACEARDILHMQGVNVR